MATKARDIMTRDPECVKETDTLAHAAQRMRDLDIGAMPICGDDGRLHGMVTDRDIVVRCIADGGDPTTVTASALATGKPVTVGADDSVDVVMATMGEHQVRRLPVIDGHQLVGIISEKDIAQGGRDRKVGDTVEEITKN